MSTDRVAFLAAELRRPPEIRPEMVERGRALAADPGYPPASMNRILAELILAAPDLSDDQA